MAIYNIVIAKQLSLWPAKSDANWILCDQQIRDFSYQMVKKATKSA